MDSNLGTTGDSTGKANGERRECTGRDADEVLSQMDLDQNPGSATARPR